MSEERSSSGHKRAGPLTLQMGAVTGAVDDLVHGYEQLVHALPNLTETISNVHADTEQMAKALEHRTRNLVEGYEYIQGLATQLPEMFKETAEQHRRTLQGAIHSLGPEEQTIIAENEEKLSKIKMEMQLMCHERIVGDVLMRPLITETKRIHEQAKKEESAMQQQQYARHLADASSRANINNTTANRVLNSRVVAQNNPTARPTSIFSTPSTSTTHSGNKIGHRGSTVVLTNSRNAELGDIHVSYKDTAEHLSTPIYIPPYEYNRPRPPVRAAGNAQKHGSELGGFLNFNYDYEARAGDVIHSGYTKLVARAVNDKKMVPSMRHGSLPPEVANLFTTPTQAPSASDYLVLTNRKKSIKRKVTFIEKETIAKSLVSKLQHTDSEVEELKKKLHAAHNKFGKDQSAAIAKLHALILELQNANSGRDEALIAAVEALLREYQLKQKAAPAVNHDAAILKALEMLLTPPPPVIDRLHEYKVLTVRPKVPVPVRTVPVVVPVPAPKVEVVPTEIVEEKKEVSVTVEVQTDPLPVPVVPVPTPPTPVTPLPQPQQVVVNVPVQNNVERELIDLMHNVVNTQHQTMQGNQALILSLIHERNMVYQEVTEYTSPVIEEPIPAPIVAPIPPPPVQTPVVIPLPPQYSTNLGTVILGAQSLEGAYATPPTLIPTEHKPCILRGIPPPERRPVQPVSRVPEEKDILVAGDLVPAHVPRSSNEADTDNAVVDNNNNNIDPATSITSGTPAVAYTDATKPTGTDANTVTMDPNTTTAVKVVTEVESTPLLNTPNNHNSNLGLTLSGTSSTAGRGGSTQHSTAGTTHMVPAHTIPPYMRRKASDFTLRALLGNNYCSGDNVCNNSDKIGVNSNTTMYKNSLGFNAEADSKAAGQNTPNVVGTYGNTLSTTDGTTTNNTGIVNTGDQGLNNLFRNLQLLSSAPIGSQPSNNNNNIAATNTTPNNASNTTITPEFLSQQISEGVQRGVKEALGLMDTHRTHRTYYNTHPSTNDILHHPTSATSNSTHVPHDKLNYDTRGLLHNTTDDTPSAIRKSLTLLKNKRASRRPSAFNAGVRSTYYADLPHCTNHTDQSNYNTNYIEQNHVPNRDTCQPLHRKALAQQQRQAEHKTILEDILCSTTNTHNMIAVDENSSFNDSVSLDETTAAYLRDPLTYNMHAEKVYQDNNSVVSSLDCDIGPYRNTNVKLMQRDVHTKKHQELFASTANAPVKAHTTHTKHKPHNIDTNNNTTNEDTHAFVPLVSRVLDQSATEDVLHHQLYARPAASDSVDSTSVDGTSGYGKNVDNDADNDAKMWDLTASAPLVTFKTDRRTCNTGTNQTTSDTKPATHATHTDGTLATMRLLSTKPYQPNEMNLDKSEDSFVSIGSSVEYSSTDDRSILTHSTNSTDISVADSQAAADTNAAATFVDKTHPVASSVPVYKRTSTTDINRANLAEQSMNTSVSNSVNSLSSDSTTNSRRVSMLPRYSPHKYNKSEPTPATSNTKTNADTDNTERLAAHMMLNVLELHRPSNYNTTPYISNPISSHLKRNGYPTSARSKIYATESVDSASSNSVKDRRYTNNRYFNASPDSDLDCTGSSISSAPDELLEHALYNNNVNSYSDTTSKPKSGLTLMGVGSNKLLRIHRK